MKELVRGTDVIQLSAIRAALAEAGIEAVEFDTHASVMDGSIGALPRRLMVLESDFEEARRIMAAVLADAGL